MNRMRAWPIPAAVATAALAIAIILLAEFASPTQTGAAAGLCSPPSGASHPTITGPLTITSPGLYNGDGQTISGGTNNIVIQASNVTVCNYTLKNAGDSAVYIGFDPYSNIKLGSLTIQGFNTQGSTGHQDAAGVACWNCTALTVVDSSITTAKTYGDGIWIKRTNASSAGPDYIANNVISGGWDSIGSEPEEVADGGFGTGTIIERNTISNCNDDGIQVEGRDENVTVRNNDVSSCGDGVAMAPVMVGPLTVSGNYIHDLRYAPSSAFFCYKMGSSLASGTPEIDFTDNTCITGNSHDPNGEGAGGFTQTNPGLEYKILASGNCTQTARYVIEFSDTPASGSLFQGNQYYTSDPDRFAKWGGSPLSLLGLQSKGIDLNSFAQPCSDSSPPPSSNTPIPTPTTPAPTRSPRRTHTPTPSAASPTPVGTSSSSPTPVGTSSSSPTPTPTPADSEAASPSGSPAPTPTPTRVPQPVGGEFIRADIDCDGHVTSEDVLRILQIVSEQHYTGHCSQIADINCDGGISDTDALALLLAIAHGRANSAIGCPISVGSLGLH